MKAVLQSIRILVVIVYVNNVCCQDGFSDQDLLRLQQIAANDGQIETITSYSSNIIQRDPSSQSLSSVSVQYMTDDAEKNEDYNARSGRSRKVFRIKNPFQRQLEDDGQQQTSNTGPQDSNAGASNQYASMQYSLPPEEFLQQMRAENQYYQQQQQVSTQAPNIGYTATPQPPYQYSTIAASGYDNSNQQTNHIPQLEPKMSSVQNYRSIPNSYQYNGPNSYVESVQSTPSPIPPYLSTSLPNNQFIGTPSNTYLSSSSPIYLSSSPNLQQYISSSISALQTGTPDYSNKVTSTIGSNALSYENNEQNKKMQIDHYDNSAIGVRYPINMQQQYQNEYPTSTTAPSSTPYPEQLRDSWQNAINVGPNSISKSLQEAQYQNYLFNRNQDGRSDSISENSNSDTHRVGNMPSANNLYLNFVRPDYQALSNLRTRTRDVEHETGQPDFYSHGEYGWKMNDRKPTVSQSSGYSSENYPRYQAVNSQPENVAVSQMTFHMDNGRPHNFNQISKSSPENDAQEFARAAAKAQENLKRQQIYENYAMNYNTNNPSPTHSNNYYNNNERQRNKIYSDSSSANPYLYSNSQQDLITVSPYYYANSRENSLDDKPKQPFDHDRALKNIVPIDVSNVVSNSENQQKAVTGLDNTNRFNLQSVKDQVDQNVKQNVKTITDSYYQDKNAIYAFNIKPKPDEASPEGFKLLDSGSGYYTKQPQTQDHFYSQASLSDNKRYADGSPQSVNHIPQISNYQDNVQSSANIQQQGLQRPQAQHPSDITSILKLNDIPHRLTQNIPAETFRLFNNNNYEQNAGLPTPLPVRINQNLGSHQLDVASDILHKLILNKQPAYNMNRPEIDPQSGGLISTINGFKVANPFNVDLKLVADMLRGKPAIDESHMIGLRDQYTRPAPLKLDLSHLQQLLANNVNQAQINDGLGAYSSPYLDIYSSGRYPPYQGVKYSRSQEEEESIIPIADSSNNHPIGAVIEQDDPVNGHEVNSASDITAQDDDNLNGAKGYKEDRPKNSFSPGHRGMGDRHKHPNSLLPGRHPFQRKYPKSGVAEPYPLLKPPPPQSPRGRGPYNKKEKHTRRRRVRRPKVVRLLKAEPLFEAESDDVEPDVPILLRPPHPVAEAKSDVNDEHSEGKN